MRQVRLLLVLVAHLLGLPITGQESPAPTGRFIENQDGTTTDINEKRMWSSRDNGADINWFEANSYCDRSILAGYTDWRLPTEEEIRTLFFRGRNIDCGTGLSCHIYSPFILTDLALWTSFRVGDKFAEVQYFTNGGVQPDRLEIADDHRVLCVRPLASPKGGEEAGVQSQSHLCVVVVDVWRFGEVSSRPGGGIRVSGYRGFLRDDWVDAKVPADSADACRDYCTRRWRQTRPNDKNHVCREGGRK